MSAVAARASSGVNRYGGLGENDVVYTTAPRGRPAGKPPLIIAHPRASSAVGMTADPAWVELYEDLAEDFVVSVNDTGGSVTWGNTNARNAISTIRTQLIDNYGAVATKVGLLGISMGGLAVFNWAKANPSLAGFVCGIVPALNLADLKTVTGGTYGAEIDTAYGGVYSDGNQGPTSSPYVYRTGWPGGVPTGIWYSPSDVICRPQWAEGFKAAVGSAPVEIFQVRDSAGGSPAHQDAVPPSIAGLSSGPYAFPRPADWCQHQLRNVAF